MCKICTRVTESKSKMKESVALWNKTQIPREISCFDSDITARKEKCEHHKTRINIRLALPRWNLLIKKCLQSHVEVTWFLAGRVIQPKTRTAEAHNQNYVKSAGEPKKAPSDSKRKKKGTHSDSPILGHIYRFISDITSFPLFIRLNE